jgi:exodeoxyribonuclease-3
MKITTWNVNSLTARLQHVLDWTGGQPGGRAVPAGTEAHRRQVPAGRAARGGLRSHCAFGQKTYNGVAILSRAPLREVVKNIVGFEDEHSRVMSVTVDTPEGALRVVNGYFVNGQAPGSEKFAYKMRWLAACRPTVRAEMAHHPQLVLLGDFNIAPEDRTPSTRWACATPSTTRRKSASTSAVAGAGPVDSFRLFEQPEKSFSWWDYRMLGYQKNRGLRIDHILVSEALKPQVKGCTIDRVPRKWEKPSDHAPVTVELG